MRWVYESELTLYLNGKHGEGELDHKQKKEHVDYSSGSTVTMDDKNCAELGVNDGYRADIMEECRESMVLL
jgi:hypothetical protein